MEPDIDGGILYDGKSDEKFCNFATIGDNIFVDDSDYQFVHGSVQFVVRLITKDHQIIFSRPSHTDFETMNTNSSVIETKK